MQSQKQKYDVIVIGGGASGMMAAGRAGERGKSVLLIEKNAGVGKKLDITGGGRCNITNAEYDKHAFLKNYGEAQQFLYSPLSVFGVQDTFDFFTKRGLPLVVEARKRAFPETQKATDVTKVLKKYIADNKVEILTKVTVHELRAEKGRVVEAVTSRGLPVPARALHAGERGTQTGTYSADKFIVATGGVSHPETGSTGDGFKWLNALGHTVNPATPTIVPIKVRESWVKAQPGVTLANMKITFFGDGKKAFSKKGPLLFTHFGLSGPTILNCAGAVGQLLSEGDVNATIDMFPDMDFAELEKNLLSVIDTNKNKDFKNVLEKIVPDGRPQANQQISWLGLPPLPAGLARAVLGLLALPQPDIKSHSVTKEERKRLVHILKAAPLTITGLMGVDRAVISDGGVPLAEVDTRAMRSLIVKNLYLTGDVLHINRPSGGYSLQMCWTTGYVAGNNV
ncbi:MAG: NAD(P)/FAD-dependent oxidoreductase [bacterium]|nr:NAD(P)/FAD-dependent oxidoreductase [bacterium]